MKGPSAVPGRQQLPAWSPSSLVVGARLSFPYQCLTWAIDIYFQSFIKSHASMTLRHVSYLLPEVATWIVLSRNSRVKMAMLGRGRELLDASQKNFSNYKLGFSQTPGPVLCISIPSSTAWGRTTHFSTSLLYPPKPSPEWEKSDNKGRTLFSILWCVKYFSKHFCEFNLL